MNVNVDITGILSNESRTYFRVNLITNGLIIDHFVLNLKKNEIDTEMRYSVKKILGVGDSYEDYLKLIKDLELEIPTGYKKHWTPTQFKPFFYISSLGEVIENEKSRYSFEKLVINYNAFPTRELAEKALNVSKLGRLILLWQYANECLFTPDWSDVHEDRYLVFYSNREKKLLVQHTEFSQEMLVYFKSKEQATAFFEMYDKEIKNIIGVMSK